MVKAVLRLAFELCKLAVLTAGCIGLILLMIQVAKL